MCLYNWCFRKLDIWSHNSTFISVWERWSICPKLRSDLWFFFFFFLNMWTAFFSLVSSLKNILMQDIWMKQFTYSSGLHCITRQVEHKWLEYRPSSHMSLSINPPLPPLGCVTLVNSLYLSKRRFLPLQNRDKNTVYVMGGCED